MNREYGRALALLDEAISACRATGESFVQAPALNTAGRIHGELHDHDGALGHNGQSLELAAVIETADTEITSNARLNLGDSLVALGRFADADQHCQAVDLVARQGLYAELFDRLPQGPILEVGADVRAWLNNSARSDGVG